MTLESPEPVNQHFTGINFPILRYSDVLLMFAEAENQLNGPTAVAQEAIDLVRNRAGLKNLSVVKTDAIASQESFFQEIVDERFRELCFEGHRKHDLIRWGLLEEKLEEAYDAIRFEPGYNAAQAYKHRDWDNFEKGSTKHLSLPYPEQEILINNLLDQKDLWK